MKTIKKFLLASILAIFWMANLSMFNTVNAQKAYNDFLSESVSEQKANALRTAIHWWDDVITDKTWADLFNKQVLQIIGYIIDIFIVVWIAVAFIGAYKIMTSEKEDASKEWMRLVLFGIVWIIVMVSARFLAEWLTWEAGEWWEGIGIIREAFDSVDSSEPNWIKFSSALYNKIIYPFIKVALYFVAWILFFMTVARVVTYVTSTDDSVKKKAWWVIIWCAVWIFIVMWAKQLVEAVMWKQKKVLNTDDATWIDGGSETWMWNWILWFENIPLVIQIINWVMWLTMFAILILIIIQWYRMFTKPDDPKNRESLKKTLIYIVIWVLVIWAAYAISSALVINNQVVVNS